MNTRIAIALAACTVLLASCGGGSGGDAPATTTTTGVPSSAQPSASGSASGLVAYIQQLIAGNNETDEPVSLDNVTLTNDDTGEPIAI